MPANVPAGFENVAMNVEICVRYRRLWLKHRIGECSVRTLLRLFFLYAVLVGVSAEAAELSAVQKTQVSKFAELVKEAGVNYQTGEFQAAGKSVETAMDMIDGIMTDAGPELYDAIAPAFPRLIKAQALLELEGISIRPFVIPSRPDALAAKPPLKRPVVPKPTRTGKPPASVPDVGAAMPGKPAINPFAASIESISFTKSIAPILVEHCGRCHITGSRGDFSMSTFRILAKGPPEGVVIFPGDFAGSRLIETIETGSMPKGGGKVPAAQLKVLKDWITGGAKYDGASPDIPLASLVTVTPATNVATTAATPAMVGKPTGKETVSFAKDIAPILLKNCNGCHVDAMQGSGGLRMDNFALLLRGGDSGPVMTSENASMSLLIRKLKGEEGDRMPAGGRPPLSPEQITMVSKWIDEGAVLDGESENQSLRVMSSLAWAKSATEDELNERRAKQAIDNLKLVTGEAPRSAAVTSDRFFVVGDVGEATLKAVSEAAQKAWKEINPWVAQDGLRGRITIFVMPRRYDYSEFAKMVEQRSVPAQWQSHWSYDGIDAYVAMLATAEDKNELLKARLIGPLASLAMTMRSSGVPRWFAEGAGRVAASKIVPRDLPAVDSWNRELATAIGTMKDGQQLIKNELPPEQADLVAYGVVGVMSSRSQRRQYDTLLRTLPKATSFDAAFEESFGVTPANYVTRLKQNFGTLSSGR